MEIKLDELKMMTQKEVANILGVSLQTVRLMCIRKEIAFHIVSKKKKITNFDLRRYLENGRVEVKSQDHDINNNSYLKNKYAAPDDVQL